MADVVELPIEKLREMFNYDAMTGVLTWRVGNRSGKAAGTKNENSGHPRIQIGVTFNGAPHLVLAHRLIWALVHGRWPAREIDHIDGDGLNNRLANLREATHAENAQNRRSLAGGTYFIARIRRFAAEITANGKKVRLGCFATREEARAKYLAAKASLHPFQPIPREVS
jgi:hypothetical protein